MISTTTTPLSATLTKKHKPKKETPTSRFQAGPSDKEPIDIPFLGQLLAVLFAHATAVDDPRGLGRLLGNGLTQPLPYLGVDLLRLPRRGHFTRADGPDGFVRDDDPGPIFRLGRDGFELRRHHLDGLVAFSLLFFFRLPGWPCVLISLTHG